MSKQSLLAFGMAVACFLLPNSTPAAHAGEPVVFRSGPGRARLLELYTSEGCSSCPPADAWLSRWRGNERLWRDVVPVAFHVDYWDNLGWKDRFASHAYTNRQRAYAAGWNTGTVYTPGFVLDGNEWSGWRSGGEDGLGKPGTPTVGPLVATVRDGRSVGVSCRTAASDARKPGRQVFVALLACGVKSSVRAGENSGRELKHDFVAVSCEERPLPSDGQEAVFRLPDAPPGAERLALAAWVSAPGGLGADQAAGGWLSDPARK